MSDTIVPIDTQRKELVDKFKEFQSNRDNFDEHGDIKSEIIDIDINGIMLHIYDPIRKMCENSEPLIKDNLERNLNKMFTVRYYDKSCYKGVIYMKRAQLFNIFNDLTESIGNYTFDIQKSYGSFKFDTWDLNIVSTVSENYGLPFIIENIDNGFSFEFWSTEMLNNLVATNEERYTLLPLLMTQSRDLDIKDEDAPKDTDKDLINLSHISIIVIDKQTKNIYHYDSNGQYSYYYNIFKDTMGDVIGDLLDKMMSDYLTKSFPEYKFEKVYDFPALNNVMENYKYDFDKGHCMINSIIMPYLLHITGKTVEELGKLFTELPNHILTIMIYTFASNLAHHYMKTEVAIYTKKDKKINSQQSVNPDPNINSINTHNNNVLSTIGNQTIPNTPYTNPNSQFSQFHGNKDETINILMEKVMLLESRIQHFEEQFSQANLKSMIVENIMTLANSEITEM